MCGTAHERPNWWDMPQRANKTTWRTRRQRIKGRNDKDADQQPAAPSVAEEEKDPVSYEVKRSPHSAADLHTLYAMLAWLPDYTHIFRLLATQNGADAQVEQHASQYRLTKMRREGDEAEEVRMRSVMRISHDIDRQKREKNMHYVPFAQAVKSIVFLSDQVKAATWENERRNKRVPGKQFAMDVLRRMVDVRPKPAFTVHQHIAHAVFDNTYSTQGAGTGSQRSRANERIDGEGHKLVRQRAVYINSMDVAVNEKLCVLSQSALDQIAQHGPYTQEFSRVLIPMHPNKSNAFMDGLLRAAVAVLAQHDTTSSTFTLDAMVALIGHANVYTGEPEYLTDLPPIMNCDTAKITDLVRIFEHFHRIYGCIPLVLRVTGDGQSVKVASLLKRYWPDLYKHVLITNGHWHSSAHFLIQGVTLFWYSFYARYAWRAGQPP